MHKLDRRLAVFAVDDIGVPAADESADFSVMVLCAVSEAGVSAGTTNVPFVRVEDFGWIGTGVVSSVVGTACVGVVLLGADGVRAALIVFETSCCGVALKGPAGRGVGLVGTSAIACSLPEPCVGSPNDALVRTAAVIGTSSFWAGLRLRARFAAGSAVCLTGVDAAEAAEALENSSTTRVGTGEWKPSALATASTTRIVN
mmetsp:Transcript_34939/g.82344  ORF Transcript_34939/g.82344 Transcript_34939/m.82344 type:complete len:201 (+) Transcript_34939:837-1439(+)